MSRVADRQREDGVGLGIWRFGGRGRRGHRAV